MTIGEFLLTCEEKVFAVGSEKQQWAWLRWMNGLGSPGRIPNLAAVRAARLSLRAEEVFATLFMELEATKQSLGDAICGFALVAWGTSGELRSTYSAEFGPIGRSLVPTLVADALNRHLAVELTLGQLAAGQSPVPV